ncbi:hypothetical protein CDD83_3150 [Cordyceps sp. RAO-2017]|nr:hypothetical protein CDD83_3150 [Cordyceps sp. RAO-2017]
MSPDEAAGRSSLTPAQAQALLDILTHDATYAEIEAFKSPDAVTRYGHPFSSTMPPEALGGRRSAATTPVGTAPSTPRLTTTTQANGTSMLSPGLAKLCVDDDAPPTTMPLLQTLLAHLVLPLPGVRDLPPEFWSVRVQGLLARLAAADLCWPAAPSAACRPPAAATGTTTGTRPCA